MTSRPDGRTASLSFALFGHPVGHSRSAELLDGLQLEDGRLVHYAALDVPDASLDRAFETIRSGRYDGANVTVPHKRRAAGLVDRLDAAALALAAINVVSREMDGALRGSSTDGAGFLEALGLLDPDLSRGALILGSGGAARAVEAALGSREVISCVVSRRPRDARPVLPETRVIGWDHESLGDLASHCGLIVQATPLGMQPMVDLLPGVPERALSSAQSVIDLVYEPWETRFLALSRSRGARACNGWPMLVGQAAAALDTWAGRGAGVAVRERASCIETRDPLAP